MIIIFYPAFISQYRIPAYIQHNIYTDSGVVPNDIKFIGEVFIPIVLPNILPIYHISNFGRIYTTRTNIFKKPTMDSKGYLRLGLSIGGKEFKFRIHRLVLMMFNPIPDCDKYQVNHKDGCRYNNCLYNLEWVTNLENMRHSINYLRDGNFISIETAYSIGKMLADNVLSFLKIAEIHNCPMYIVSNISKGISHKDVYDYYNLGNVNFIKYGELHHNCKITDDQVKLIKTMLSNNVGVSEISRLLNISKSTISHIKSGHTHKNI